MKIFRNNELFITENYITRICGSKSTFLHNLLSRHLVLLHFLNALTTTLFLSFIIVNNNLKKFAKNTKLLTEHCYYLIQVVIGTSSRIRVRKARISFCHATDFVQRVPSYRDRINLETVARLFPYIWIAPLSYQNIQLSTVIDSIC